MGLNFLQKNELAVKGNSYVGYLFNKKGQLIYSFHLCHILPGIATIVILVRIINGKKLCWQGPRNEHMGSWGYMIYYL